MIARSVFRGALLLLVVACQVAAAPQTITVPPGVSVEGVPSMPQSLADELQVYARFHAVKFLGWHPTQRRLLARTRLDNAPQLYQVTQPETPPAAITSFPDGVSDVAAYDRRDGQFLVFVKDVGGGAETNQLFRYDAGSGATALLTDGRSRYGDPTWARRGRWIAYDATRRNGHDRDVYVMDPSDPSTERLVAQVTGAWAVADWSPDDRTLLAVETRSLSDTSLWRIEVATGRRHELTAAAGAPVLWRDASFSADGLFVYAISDKDSDTPRLWRTAAAAGPWMPVTPDHDPVGSFALSGDGKMGAIVFERDGNDVVEIVDVPSLRRRATVPLPTGTITGLRWRPGTHEVGMTFASVQVAGDVYSFDANLARLTRWTTSDLGFDGRQLPAPEIIHWRGVDGQALSGILYKPAARFTGPRPVMVNIHGGPFDRERVRFQGRSNDFLDSLGIAIIFPNVRGSDGFGKAFGHLDDGRRREDAVKDVGALLGWVGTRSDLDPNRVMLTGASYGGYLALASAMAFPDRVRCVFAAAAISNFVTFLESTEPSRQQERRAEYGDERDPLMRQFLAAISPVHHAADLRVPLMIAHGAKDARVPVSQAQDIINAARLNRVPVWSVIYGDAGHDNFPATRSNADYNFYCWIAFVKQFLLG